MGFDGFTDGIFFVKNKIGGFKMQFIMNQKHA